MSTLGRVIHRRAASFALILGHDLCLTEQQWEDIQSLGSWGVGLQAWSIFNAAVCGSLAMLLQSA